MINLELDRGAAEPLYLQIAGDLRRRIAAGLLPAGTKLPPTRMLARRLGVNRNTVNNAYEELLSEGLAQAHVGQGTFVTGIAAEEGETPAAAEAGAPPERFPWGRVFNRRAVSDDLTRLMERYQLRLPKNIISFALSAAGEEELDLEDLRRAMNYILRRSDNFSVFTYGQAAGYLPLRRYLAQTIQREEIYARPQEILITNGSQQALNLVASVLVEAGDTVALENPTYPGAIQIFRYHGAELAGLERDDEGPDPEYLERLLSRRRVKLLYLVPNFRNPTGETISRARRRELMELVRRFEVPVLEDDLGGRLVFGAPHPPALRSLDLEGQVVYVSSFSKNLMPGLRLGWMVAPPPLMKRLMALKQLSDIATSQLSQAALWEFCRRGYLERHLQRVRELFQEKREAMLGALERWLPPEVTWTRPTGGVYIWVTLPARLNAAELLVRSAKRGVLFSAGELFYLDGRGTNELRLSFAGVTGEQIERGVRILGEVIGEYTAHTPHRSEETQPPEPLVPLV